MVHHDWLKMERMSLKRHNGNLESTTNDDEELKADRSGQEQWRQTIENKGTCVHHDQNEKRTIKCQAAEVQSRASTQSS